MALIKNKMKTKFEKGTICLRCGLEKRELKKGMCCYSAKRHFFNPRVVFIKVKTISIKGDFIVNKS